MKVFKQYSEFEYGDFESILQEVKLNKIHRGERIVNFGDNADTIYCILAGRVAITHPKEKLTRLKAANDPKLYKQTVEHLTQKETDKKLKMMKTFITSKGTIIGNIGGEAEMER